MALKINGEVVPEQAILVELRRLMHFYSEHMPRAALGKQMPVLLAQAREQVIGAKLLLLEARRRGIAVPDAEIDARVREMAKQSGGDDKLQALLRRQNLTVEALRTGIRDGRTIDRFVARIIEHIEAPEDAQVREYYENNPGAFSVPGRAQVRHILLKPADATPAAREATFARLDQLKRQCREGADFAELAAAHSECPSGRKTGGSLGWITRGVTLPEFDQVLFGMKVGDVSDVFQTPLGCHIIQKTAEEPGESTTFDDVREKIVDLLTHQARGRAITRVVNELKKKATIEDDGPLSQSTMDAVLDSFLDSPGAPC